MTPVRIIGLEHQTRDMPRFNTGRDYDPTKPYGAVLGWTDGPEFFSATLSTGRVVPLSRRRFDAADRGWSARAKPQ